MWLVDFSIPSLEGYHKHGALIGPGQATGSTGGFDSTYRGFSVYQVELRAELRNCAGDSPTRLEKALVKVVTSWYPTSCETVLIGKSVVFNKCLARLSRI